MPRTFYITTPIYYINGDPHIGHLYTTLAGDIIKRAIQLYAPTAKVYLRTGVDEHGLKVQRKAESLGMTPQELCEKNYSNFLSLFQESDISFDDFIRTTSDKHKTLALSIFKKLQGAGHIYLSAYKGWYSESDECFYPEEETYLVDNVRYSTFTNSKLEYVEEASYFFRLSSFQTQLVEWLEHTPDIIQPEGRRKEVLAFLKNDLNDLSITRTSFSWGIPLGDKDPDHVLYVWIDALTNYLHDFEGVDAWPADIQLLGKDILRFHAIIWPAMLMACDLPLPKKLFAHGWWMGSDGQKMSKSLNNSVNVRDLLQKYDHEILRYYFFRETPFGEDGYFSEDNLKARYREISNKYGNLVNRVFALARKYNLTVEQPSKNANSLLSYYLNCDFHRALQIIVDDVDYINSALQNNAPWRKDLSNEEREKLLKESIEVIYNVTLDLGPFFPGRTQRVIEAIQSNNWGLPILFAPID